MSIPNPAQVHQFFINVQYPARRGQLILLAQQEGAPQEVIDALRRIPDGEYSGPSEVTKALRNLG